MRILRFEVLLASIGLAWLPSVSLALFEAGYGAQFGGMGYDAAGTITANSGDYPTWYGIGAYAQAWGPSQFHDDPNHNGGVPGVQFAQISGNWQDEGLAQYCVLGQTAKWSPSQGFIVTGYGSGGAANCLFFDP